MAPVRIVLSATVSTLTLRLALEVCARGIFLTWSAYDPIAEAAQGGQFYRPEGLARRSA